MKYFKKTDLAVSWRSRLPELDSGPDLRRCSPTNSGRCRRSSIAT